MKNFIQTGDVLGVIAGADTLGGAVVVLNSLIGVAVADAKSGEELVIKTRGVFDGAPKATGETWAVGDPLYWSTANSNFTKTAASNKLAAQAIAAAASADVAGSVRIGYPIIL